MLATTKALPTQAEVDRFSWHHEIDFGDGIRSNGNTKINVLRAQANYYYADDIVRGRSVLDVGCWDGFNSFEAARRGASRVLATDHFAWSHECWGNRAAFDLARSCLAPSVEVMDADLDELTLERVGPFDIVLFAGVFYHLRHPFAALEKVACLAREYLIVETHVDGADIGRPAMIFYPGKELADDHTNWWGPNNLCVEAMLRDLGFSEVQTLAHPMHRNRSIFRGRRGF